MSYRGRPSPLPVFIHFSGDVHKFCWTSASSNKDISALIFHTVRCNHADKFPSNSSIIPEDWFLQFQDTNGSNVTPLCLEAGYTYILTLLNRNTYHVVGTSAAVKQEEEVPPDSLVSTRKHNIPLGPGDQRGPKRHRVYTAENIHFVIGSDVTVKSEEHSEVICLRINTPVTRPTTRVEILTPPESMKIKTENDPHSENDKTQDTDRSTCLNTDKCGPDFQSSCNFTGPLEPKTCSADLYKQTPEQNLLKSEEYTAAELGVRKDGVATSNQVPEAALEPGTIPVVTNISEEAKSRCLSENHHEETTTSTKSVHTIAEVGEEVYCRQCFEQLKAAQVNASENDLVKNPDGSLMIHDEPPFVFDSTSEWIQNSNFVSHSNSPTASQSHDVVSGSGTTASCTTSISSRLKSNHPIDFYRGDCSSLGDCDCAEDMFGTRSSGFGLEHHPEEAASCFHRSTL